MNLLSRMGAGIRSGRKNGDALGVKSIPVADSLHQRVPSVCRSRPLLAQPGLLQGCESATFDGSTDSFGLDLDGIAGLQGVGLIAAVKDYGCLINTGDRAFEGGGDAGADGGGEQKSRGDEGEGTFHGWSPFDGGCGVTRSCLLQVCSFVFTVGQHVR